MEKFWKEISNLQKIVGAAIVTLLWLLATFQTKESAANAHDAQEKVNSGFTQSLRESDARINQRVDNLEHTLGDVAKDTNYIRGRLEPRGK